MGKNAKKKINKKDLAGTIILSAIGIIIIAVVTAIIISSVKGRNDVKKIEMPVGTSSAKTESTNPLDSLMGGGYEDVQDFMDTFDEMSGSETETENEYDPYVSEEYTAKTDAMKTELAYVNSSYSSAQAAADGFVVIKDGGNENVNKIREFYEKTRKGESAQLNVAYYNDDESSILVRAIRYDKNKYYGIVDMTDYEYSSQDYMAFEYPFCKLYEQSYDNSGKIYYSLFLTDSDDYTFDNLMNMDTSTNADDWEKFLYVCEYAQ